MQPGTSQTMRLNGTEAEFQLAPTVLVFSHGFGVRRDSRGMFTDLAHALLPHIGYVLFDYDHPEGGGVRAAYATEQVARLQAMVTWAAGQPGVQNVGIVAHSRGCLIAAMAHIQPLPIMIMLAPPLARGHARQYFTRKPGVVRRGDDWYVPRSDGTVTIIPEGVFEEFDTVQRESILLDYADMQPMLVVTAGKDAVLGEQNYAKLRANQNITFATIADAGHDFAGAARSPLIDRVQEYVKAQL